MLNPASACAVQVLPPTSFPTSQQQPVAYLPQAQPTQGMLHPQGIYVQQQQPQAIYLPPSQPQQQVQAMSQQQQPQGIYHQQQQAQRIYLQQQPQIQPGGAQWGQAGGMPAALQGPGVGMAAPQSMPAAGGPIFIPAGALPPGAVLLPAQPGLLQQPQQFVAGGAQVMYAPQQPAAAAQPVQQAPTYVFRMQ